MNKKDRKSIEDAIAYLKRSQCLAVLDGLASDNLKRVKLLLLTMLTTRNEISMLERLLKELGDKK